MKTKIILCLWLLLIVTARAQVMNIYVAADNAFGVGNWNYVSPNNYTNTDFSQHLSASYNAATTNWDFYNGSTLIFFTTNTPAVPTNSAIYQLYTNGAAYFVLSTPIQAQFFDSAVASNNMVISSNTLAGFWRTNGSTVLFDVEGYNNSVANSNVLICVLGTNMIFSSPPTAGRGNYWRMDGLLQYNGSNMITSLQYRTGDTNRSYASAFGVLTNIAVVSVPFALALAGGYDTNLNITSGSIYSTVVVPPATTPASLNFAPAAPGVFQSIYTVTNSTDSSFGYGAGLMVLDTNYVYVTVGTNLWKRATLSSW